MAGSSISLMKMDDDLKTLLDEPCQTSCLTVAGPLAQRGVRAHRSSATFSSALGEIDHSALIKDGPVTPGIFRDAMLATAQAIADNRKWLSELDGVIGDGDHGITMDIGWAAVREVLADAHDLTISQMSNQMAKAFLDAVGASTGPLYSSAFKTAGKNVAHRLKFDAEAMVAWIEGMLEGILARGGAKQGDKTMIDAWAPAVAEARFALKDGGDLIACMEAACAGAKTGRDYTTEIESKRGRSKKLGARSVGHMDPGAASAHVMLVAMTNSIKQLV